MTLFSILADDTRDIRKFIGSKLCDDFEVLRGVFRGLFDDFCIVNISVDDFICGIALTSVYGDVVHHKIKDAVLRRAAKYWFTVQDGILLQIASAVVDMRDGDHNANEACQGDYDKHAAMKSIIKTYKGVGSESDMIAAYLAHLDIAKILLTCDKFAMTAQLDDLICLNAPSQNSTMIIHHGYDTDNNDYSQIACAYINNHYLLFNGIFTYYSYKRNNFGAAVDNGLCVTELILGDNDFVNDVTPKLYENLRSFDLNGNCRMPRSCNQDGSSASFAHFTSLTSLNIEFESRMDYKSKNFAIPNADICNIAGLRALNCDNNKKITQLGSLVDTLSVLFMRNCKITFLELSWCKMLERLVCDGVCDNGHGEYFDPSKPFDLSANSLTVLSWANVNHLLRCDALSNCVKLEKFCCTDNSLQFSQFSLPSLRVLVASGKKCSVCDDTIRFCATIEELDCCDNIRITTCEPFAKSLRILHARRSVMTDIGLSKCVNIEELDCMDSKLITTCAPFYRSLLRLNMIGSGIVNNGLLRCKYIKVLAYDSKIPKCDSFITSLKVILTIIISRSDHAEICALHKRAGGHNKIKFNQMQHFNSSAIEEYFTPMSQHFAWE